MSERWPVAVKREAITFVLTKRLTVARTARALIVPRSTVDRWLRQYRAGGEKQLGI